MNMCLLKVAMLEKCKSSHFQSKGGSKKFEYWGVKKIVGLGGTFTLCVCGGGVSTPLHAVCDPIVFLKLNRLFQNFLINPNKPRLFLTLNSLIGPQHKT